MASRRGSLLQSDRHPQWSLLHQYHDARAVELMIAALWIGCLRSSMNTVCLDLQLELKRKFACAGQIILETISSDSATH